MRRLPDNIFQVFRLVPFGERVTFGCGLFVISILELVGIAMVAPILAAILTETSGVVRGKSFITLYFKSFFEWLGLDYTLINIILFLVACFTVKSLLTVLMMGYTAGSVSRITTEIRLDLIRNLLHAKWSYFVRQKLGRLVALTGSDISVVGTAFYNVTTLGVYAVQLCVYVLLAMLLSWKLVLFIIGAAAVLLLTFGRFIRIARKQSNKYAGQINKLAANFADSIMSIKTIKAMGRHARFGRLFERDARAAMETMRLRILSSEFASEIMEPIVVIIFVVGILVATSGVQLTFIEVLLMALVFARAMMVINSAQRTHLGISAIDGTYKNIVSVMNEAADQAEIFTGTKTPTFEKGCRTEQLSFDYDDQAVLTNINVEVPAGQITCFMGPSGAGKTTLVDLLLGLHLPKAGQIWIDDTPLEEVDIIKWRNLVGYVSQEVMLFHDTLFNNVTLGEENFTREDVLTALKEAGAGDLIDTLPDGIMEIVGERGMRLSGGQRQRVAIARALIHHPRLLILDEATTALDPDTEETICRNMKRLVDETGIGILSVSHQSKWRQVADRIYEVTPDSVNLVSTC